MLNITIIHVVISINLTLRESGKSAASGRNVVNVAGLVVGVVFGLATTALLLAGSSWRRLPHAFDWQINWQTVFASSPHTML